MFDKLREKRSIERRLKKYSNYKIASNGEAMKKYADYILNRTTLEIHNIFEIGANYGQDAEVLVEKLLNGNEENCYVFEAHPKIFEGLTQMHPLMKRYNCAVANMSGKMKFNLCDIDRNSGISSLLTDNCHDLNQFVMADVIRMDEFMHENSISSISFCKIDVEGASYDVLEGFGSELNNVAAIQIEAEHIECWENEKLWPEISQKLCDNGFELVLFERKGDQSDSLWIQSKYIKM